MTKNQKILILVVGTAAIAYFFQSREEATHAKLFCAYGRVFVEFHDSKSTWGTIILDNHGKPVPCSEDDEKLDAIPANYI